MVVAAIAALTLGLAALGVVASRSESLRSLPTAPIPTSSPQQTTPIRVTDDFGPAIASSAPASSRPPAAASMRLARTPLGRRRSQRPEPGVSLRVTSPAA